MKNRFILIILIVLTNTIYAQQRDLNVGGLNDKRIALIIGNSAYQQGNVLKNPVNDANLMIQTLKSLGFEVISRTDATKQQMEQAVREFSKKLPDNNIALFYYAGHGLQVDGMNYLIPIDANLNAKEDCKYEAIAVNFVVEEFEKFPNNINIVILDACRNNPFRSWARGGERGFKAIAPTSGTIIAFATSEGSTASDGSGTNGLFTQELTKQMKISQPIENVFKKTRVEVESLSNGAQSPQEWSKLKGDFYFVKTQGNQNNNYSNNDQPEIGNAVSTYGNINLTTEISGDLYLDGKKLATIQANKQIPINKITTGTHTIEIKGQDNWLNEVIIYKDKITNATASKYGIFTDNRDNKIYKTVIIGNQTWLAENLGYKPNTGNCWIYENNPNNLETYGYLYDWETAKNVCPSGWHLPSDDEWKQLEITLGMSKTDVDEKDWRSEGFCLKIKSKSGWNNNDNGTNQSGFNALPSGFRSYDGWFGQIGKFVGYWTNTTSENKYAWTREIESGNTKISRTSEGVKGNFSVRCIKD